MINRVMPNINLAIVFTLRGQIAFLNHDKYDPLPSAIVSGVRKTARNINYKENSKSLIVLFTEMGASSFFNIPLSELYEQSISLEYLIDKDIIQSVEENLNIAKSDFERIKILDELFLNKLKKRDLDLLIYKAVLEISAAKGNIRIKELSQKLFISIDAFEKRFRKSVGCTPKQFSSLIRLKSIIQTHRPKNLIDLALENGFYDQAHFIKEFKLFTGLTPSEFYNASNIW
nr:helix-turn-helix transcriptional regulator [Thermophagus xiamenensis]